MVWRSKGAELGTKKNMGREQDLIGNPPPCPQYSITLPLFLLYRISLSHFYEGLLIGETPTPVAVAFTCLRNRCLCLLTLARCWFLNFGRHELHILKTVSYALRNGPKQPLQVDARHFVLTVCRRESMGLECWTCVDAYYGPKSRRSSRIRICTPVCLGKGPCLSVLVL